MQQPRTCCKSSEGLEGSGKGGKICGLGHRSPSQSLLSPKKKGLHMLRYTAWEGGRRPRICNLKPGKTNVSSHPWNSNSTGRSGPRPSECVWRLRVMVKWGRGVTVGRRKSMRG